MVYSTKTLEKTTKKKYFSQKKESFSNLNIFKKIVESEKNKPIINKADVNDSYIHHSFMKVNNFGNINNSTFVFDEKKENDVVICISNLGDNDFLENSLDSNFKREILNTNTRFIPDKKNNELEISHNTQLNHINISKEETENVNLLKVHRESFIKRNKYGIIISVIFILIVVILLINFVL